jgi:hypothetical protein
MKLSFKYIFIFFTFSIFASGCTKNESNTQTSLDIVNAQKSISTSLSWLVLKDQMLICESKDGYDILKIDNPSQGLFTEAHHDNANLISNKITVRGYEADTDKLKINNDLYWGILLANGKLSNSYSEAELAPYRDAIVKKTAQIQKFHDKEYIIIPALEQKSIVEKLALKSASTPDNLIVTTHYSPGLNVKPKDRTCKVLLPKAIDSNVENFKSIDTPEKCYQYILNSLDSRLKSDKAMLDEIQENCKKPKQAACLHSKIIETRKTLKDDDLIKMDVIEEWKQQCETE